MVKLFIIIKNSNPFKLQLGHLGSIESNVSMRQVRFILAIGRAIVRRGPSFQSANKIEIRRVARGRDRA